MGSLWSCLCSYGAVEKHMPIPSKVVYPPCANDKKLVKVKNIDCKAHCLCEECEIDSFTKRVCIHCYRTLSAIEIKAIAECYFKICANCNERLAFKVALQCGCYICPCCQRTNNYASLTNCFVCKKSKSQFDDRVLFGCDICCTELKRDEMVTLDCDHYFCTVCLTSHIKSYLTENRSKIGKGIACFSCTTIINDHVIQYLLSAEEFDQYNLIMMSRATIECPNCKEVFISESDKIKCYKCKYFFCIHCKREKGKCVCGKKDNVKLSNDMSQCPGCKTPFTKDEGCSHVKCGNPDCETEYCFECSAFREPTLEHGNHYHRPQCRFYSEYDGKDDRFSEKCSLCRKAGKLCARPKNLKVPRQFKANES